MGKMYLQHFFILVISKRRARPNPLAFQKQNMKCLK